MSGFLYTIAMKITGQGGVQSAIAMTEKMDTSVQKVNRSLSSAAASQKKLSAGRRGIRIAASVMRRFRNGIGRVRTGFRRAIVAQTRFISDGKRGMNDLTSTIKSYAAGIFTVTALLGSINTAAQFDGIEKAIEFSSGKQGATNIAFLKRTVDELKLPIKESLDGFKLLQGGVMGTGITAEQTRRIFKATAMAGRVMQLSADDMNGSLRALSQIASKGKVSAEELRGQLGERIPGAFAIAARAMNMTTSQLDKALQKGEIMSDVFLPRFAAEMEKTFQGGVAKAVDSGSANLQDYYTSLTQLSVIVGQRLLPTVTQFLRNYLIPAIDWIGRNIEVVGLLTTVFGSLFLAAKTYSAVMRIVSLVTGQATFTFWGLNAAFWANPITWVVAGIIALTAAVVYAWNNFEGFRGFIVGSWEVLKEFGRIVFEWLVAPMKIFSKILIGAFTFNKEMIKSGISDAANFMQNSVLNAGQRLGQSFKKGYEKGVANFNQEDRVKALDVARSPQFDPLGIKSKTGAVANNFVANPSLKSIDQPKSTQPNEKIKSGIEAVNNGGRSVRNFNITIGKFQDKIEMHVKTVNEGVDEIADKVLVRMTQMVNSLNQIQ
ncbi:MAG: tape measure protein [Bacteroidota bacterium]